MRILSRLFGVALVGPIGAIEPTEASKRAKRQLEEMKTQTRLLGAQSGVSETAPRILDGSIPHAFVPSPYSPNLCGVCSHQEHAHFSTTRPAPAPDETGAEFKACPDCAEDVRLAARKCRFCGYRFDEGEVTT